MKKSTPLFCLLALTLTLLGGCKPPGKTPLVVFCAGSLITPFDALEKAFEAQYPDIDVQNEFHGSIQVIRHVTELHEPIDVVATADYALIPMLMYAVNDPDTGQPYADWYIRFAGNRLGLAYTPQSAYAAEITPENWTEILARPDVRVGIADPRFDAAGYRALMAYTLAQDLSDQPTLFFDQFAGQFRYPINLEPGADGSTIIHVPEVLENQTGAHVILRGASIQLIALLESGDLDYAFEYETVIQQHSLELLTLPDALNLGSPDYAAEYARATVQLDFQRFASVNPVFQGAPIGYGITIPGNAPHSAAAEQYIAFLLSPEGRAVMAAAQHPLLDAPTANGYANLPVSLQPLVTAEP